MNYAVVIEHSGAGAFGAYVPDLPGCAAWGDSVAEVHGLIREAITVHLAGLKATGQDVPEPTTQVDYVDVTA
jgi:predicted RNase H-like HicB family nuclease